ncbi:30127_t:CDS:2, partial [Gigaspora margarita]
MVDGFNESAQIQWPQTKIYGLEPVNKDLWNSANDETDRSASVGNLLTIGILNLHRKICNSKSSSVLLIFLSMEFGDKDYEADKRKQSDFPKQRVILSGNS